MNAGTAVGAARHGDYEIQVYRHSDPIERGDLFCLIGEFLVAPNVLREIGGPVSSDERAIWFVARRLETGEVSGFGALKLAAGGKATLCHSWTAPAHRRKGINAALVRLRCAYAERVGSTSLTVTVAAGRAGHYAAHGFVETRWRGKWAVLVRK